jgi:N-methylhydantoinase B
MVNDPYHGGSHLNDIHLMMPIVSGRGSLLGFATGKAHHTDVGGSVPGSMSFDNTEIYQDGIRIPPLKLVDAGVRNATVEQILRLNVRDPETLFADLEAQLASLETVSHGVVELADDLTDDGAVHYFNALLDYAEVMSRERVRQWVDGEYEFTDGLDDDGVTGAQGEPIVIRVKVTIAGDQVHVDFTGTSQQSIAAINFPPLESVSRSQMVLRCCLGGSELPNNSGLFRNMTYTVPLGTVLNPRPPAACSERGVLTYRVGEVVFGAMAKAVPDGVLAAGEGGSYVMRIGGTRHDGQQFLCLDLVQGTWGARRSRDGIDGVANVQANHMNTPMELIEANYPIRVERHALVPDTGGAGTFRGGMAIERWWRYLGHGPGFLRSRVDRVSTRPYGLFGGEPGAAAAVTVVANDGAERPVIGKGTVPLLPGELVKLRIAAGGGWGDPAERDQVLVDRDLREERITVRPWQHRGSGTPDLAT